MARKKRKLDQFLNQRRKNPEAVLAEKTHLSNRIFRGVVWLILIGGMASLVLVERTWSVSYSAGLLLLFAVLCVLGSFLLYRVQPQVFDRPSSFNRFIVALICIVSVHHFVQFMGWSPYLVPIPGLAMIIAMAYGEVTALLCVMGLALYMGLTRPSLAEGLYTAFAPSLLVPQFPVNVPLILTVTAGAVTSILGVRRIRKQSKPVLVGIAAGLVQASMVVALVLLAPGFPAQDLRDPFFLREFLGVPGWAFAGGLISGALLTCLLPPLEMFFDILTERRLLELGDPSNDLLRVLRETAPGTYQHTLGVAQLASNAAEAIGANRLIAEVGAYYHDIGKIMKPEYFVENMGEDKSIHDRLRPSMSKMVIIAHVKDGIELAEEAGVPEKIVDMIPMHHGTTIVEYFYQKARRETAQAEDLPRETEYRYPGAKPRFPEAGILMLADMVEAIAKTEAEPNPSRFRTMVHDQILKRLLDGQLDECDLTLNDLRLVEDSFVRTLTNMYHGRIKYPEQQVESGAASPPGVGPVLVDPARARR